MNKIYSLIFSLFLVSSLHAKDAKMWQTVQADNAFKGLDAEFEEKPQVLVKEKIVYKERPVEVEKIVEIEKIVYRDKPVKEPVQEQAKNTGRKYQTLFVDITVPNDPTFISDYVHLTERAGGLDWRKIDKLMLTAPARGPYSITVTGQIELPAEINSDRIYIKPIVGPMISELMVDGTSWTTSELNIINSYKKTNTLPFSISWKTGYYTNNPKSFMDNVKKNLPTMRFLVSNKPVERGEKKEFMPARIFITQ